MACIQNPFEGSAPLTKITAVWSHLQLTEHKYFLAIICSTATNYFLSFYGQFKKKSWNKYCQALKCYLCASFQYNAKEKGTSNTKCK